MTTATLWPEEETIGDVFGDVAEGRARRTAEGAPAPDDWPEWLHAMFPAHVTHDHADHQREAWEWAWRIEPESAPDPFCAIWARGGGKSTFAELATTALGVRGKRQYAIYVRETQEQADKSVGNVAALLESDAVERHYPAHADRKVGKHGQSKGWRRERLRTAGGFTVDALGLDTASRGVKVEENRPDLIILDDIDDKHDSPVTTAKKIATITHSILPAGSENVAVLAIQNLIIADGFFTRLTDGRADYLARRTVSGPHPAVVGLETEWRWDEETETKIAVITAGEPTWDGQGLDVCQRMIDRMGLAAFLKECQHNVKERAEGIALRFEERRHLEDMDDDAARALVGLGRPFGGIDFGDWRFGFILRASDTGGRVHQIAEFFSQREELLRRARTIHAICTHYGCPPTLSIWGDAANPTDIRELNARLRELSSPFRVVPVAHENKIRTTSVERMNNLLAKDALLYRRGAAEHTERAVRAQWSTLGYPGAPPDLTSWRLRYNASSEGQPQQGSRLLWEVEHWSYPVPKEGEAQKQDPDDHTADGADLIAADRYATMSFLRPADEPEEPEEVDPNEDTGLNEILKRAAEAQANGRGVRRPTKVKRKAGKVTRRER